MKKVALIYLTQHGGVYMVTNDPGYCVQRRPFLGLQYLCAVLEKKGIKTALFDQTVHPFSLKTLIEKLRDYDLVGFYCSDPQENKIKIYSKNIKEKLKIPIIVGGPSTLTNRSFLEHGCDIVVHGEGEVTIQEIVDYYDGKKKINDIKGISYKKDGKIIKNPPQDLIENIDELPFPDRSKIDVNAYYDYFLFGMKKPYITMLASRGCIYKCSFCTSCKLWGFKYRRRSVDNVLAEIDEVIKKYSIKYIAFQDDIFGGTNNWIEEFCKKLIRRNYKIKWMAIFHPLSVLQDQERILKLMKKAGCDTLSFGLQSADPEILKNINRLPQEPEKLKKILKTAKKLGFVTGVSFMFGLPGETKKNIKKSIDYSLRCGATVVNFYSLSILEGSELEIKYKNREVCKIPKKEIERLTKYASKKFYTRPKNLLRIFYFILKNPSWILNVGFKLPSILGRVGFGAKK